MLSTNTKHHHLFRAIGALVLSAAFCMPALTAGAANTNSKPTPSMREVQETQQNRQPGYTPGQTESRGPSTPSQENVRRQGNRNETNRQQQPPQEINRQPVQPTQDKGQQQNQPRPEEGSQPRPENGNQQSVQPTRR
ncbi:MAG: hypothetical protein I3I94_08640 [Acidaminococcaceae bacterium]|nr:hypothetical protein [Acidaminococcaceae bacterium]HCJ91471.1 hypothetical protein [Acidaminococcaceae bacterium]